MFDNYLINEALSFSLSFYPISFEAEQLILETISCFPSMKRKRKPSNEQINAIGAIFGALLKSAHYNRHSYLYKCMSPKDFTASNTKGHVIGYRPFVTVMNGLEKIGYVERVAGFKDPSASPFTKGIATRFRGTEKLIQSAADYGVALADWETHFGVRPRPETCSVPVQLRADNWITDRGVKHKGGPMTVDHAHPAVIAATAQVNDINRVMANQSIEPADWHHTFTRIFNQGDTVGGAYNKGGRMYSSTAGRNYQQVKRHERRFLTINGEPTSEVDIRASYLTILHHVMDVPMIGDPYEMAGVPRLVAKIWTTITLGHDRFHTRWGDEAKARYAESDEFSGRNLQKDYPFKATQAKILAHLPLLADWPNNPITWADLQYLESCAVVDAVHEMAVKHQIAGLPLHDAIIVPRSQAALAESVLSDCFLRHVGVRPTITIKNHEVK